MNVDLGVNINFYIEVISTGSRLYLPIIPDKLNVTSGANTLSFSIINSGENKIPRGVKATGYAWTGILPGKGMKNLSFIVDWQEPKKIVELIETWKRKGTPLKLVVGDFVNDDVFVEVFNREYYGQGHIKYNITMTKSPKLTVTTSPAPKSKKTSGSGDDGKKKGTVIGHKVVYRKGPGTKYKKLGTLSNGKQVTIYATKGNWYKIKEGDPEWWINSSYVKINSGTSDKKKTSTGRKKASTKTTGKGSTTGKQKLTGTAPKTSLVNPKAVVQKPSSQKTGTVTRQTK